MTERWFAPAKLNLYLHLTGRRADGYHLLDSLVAFAEIGDEITVEAADELSLTVTGPFAAGLDDNPRDNLVWRAAEALARRLGRAPEAKINLVKNLPVASGIGGGSSDAAATLRALDHLWHESLDRPALNELAASLGSDVPACLAAHSVWLGGVGEIVEPAPALPSGAVLLVNPRIPLSTPTVYRGFHGPFSPAARGPIPANIKEFAAMLAGRGNDLTASAIALVPEIGEVLQRLAGIETALLARMSGSGATCFALFKSLDEAQAAGRTLRQERSDWWVASGNLL